MDTIQQKLTDIGFVYGWYCMLLVIKTIGILSLIL